MLKITECPTCGSDKIKRVRRNWTDIDHGKRYTVPNLRFHECPACGERVYGHEAMQKIEASRPLGWRHDTRKEGRSVSDVLVKIKRTILAGRYRFSEKARTEMESDHLSRWDVAESIINASRIYKTLRSHGPRRSHSREKLYIIIGRTLGGVAVYTKGKFRQEGGFEVFYFLVSSKKAL